MLQSDDGALTTHVYNAGDQLLTVTPPSGEVTTSTWDANGNLATEKASNGLVTSYSWDEENRLAQITYPGGGFERSTYAADGLRLVSRSGAHRTATRQQHAMRQSSDRS